jgi:predicted phage tail protein
MKAFFSQGLPDISFLMKGNMVYDPRTATQAYSANAALIIADYLQDAKIGLGVNWSDIDQDALIEAADICDELVSLAGGGTEARYEIHGAFDTDMSPSEVLEEMAEAIAGDIVYQGGKWRIIPGKWRAPTVTLDENDLRSAVKIQVGTSRKDLFNCVRGTFVSRDHNYSEIDFPVIKVASYITDDGKEIYEDLQMNFVTGSTQCQRIAKIRVAQARQGIVVNVKVSLKGLLLQVGDTVNLTLAKYGWSSKIFEVRDFRISEDVQTGLTVDLSLRETAEAIYTWTTGDELEIDPAPNTSLPDPSEVADITGLTLTSGTTELYIRSDGTVFSRLKAAWTESTDVHVLSGGRYELQYKRTSASDWSSLTAVLTGTTFLHILDVQDGISYDVRVRAVNSLGAISDWATVSGHTVIGKTEPPSNVTGFRCFCFRYRNQL